MSREEIYTKEEYYCDWKSENIDSLQSEWLEENVLKNMGYKNYFNVKDIKATIRATHKKLGNGEYFDSEKFEAYCRQEFKDRD